MQRSSRGVDFVALPTRDLRGRRVLRRHARPAALRVHAERNFAEFETGNLTLSIIDAEKMGLEHVVSRMRSPCTSTTSRPHGRHSRSAASRSRATPSTRACATWRSSTTPTATRSCCTTATRRARPRADLPGGLGEARLRFRSLGQAGPAACGVERLASELAAGASRSARRGGGSGCRRGRARRRRDERGGDPDAEVERLHRRGLHRLLPAAGATPPDDARERLAWACASASLGRRARACTSTRCGERRRELGRHDRADRRDAEQAGDARDGVVDARRDPRVVLVGVREHGGRQRRDGERQAEREDQQRRAAAR